MINASPLAMGLYSEVGPPDWHRAPASIKSAVKAAFEFCKVSDNEF